MIANDGFCKKLPYNHPSILQGAFCGVMFGVTMSAWISLGGILFPGDKAPAPVQVTNCSAFGFYNATRFLNTVDGNVVDNFKPYE